MDRQNPAEKRFSPHDKKSSTAKNKSSKVTLQDIQVVQNLIERCLQLYMNRDEVVNTLLDRARIEPEFTKLVWKKLEEENAEFFKAYNRRLKLRDQIDMYNKLLEQQYHLMKKQECAGFEIAPVQNGMHHRPGAVNNLSKEYPVMQQHVTPSTGYSEINSMGSISGCQGGNGIPASGNFHHMQQKCAEESPADTIPFFPAVNMKLEGSKSGTLNEHLPFTPETSGLNLDIRALDSASAFTFDIANLERLCLKTGDQNSHQASDQMTWDFGFSNTAEWSNFQDFGPNYSGSQFQPSELDTNVDSAEQNDMVDGFLLDGPPGQGTQPEETRPK